MTLPLLGTLELVPYAAGTSNPSHPAATVLDDDTVLIAWQNLTSGQVTVRLYTRDLATATDETTFPAATDLGVWLDGMAAFPNGDGATLAVDNRVFAVTTGPLTVTQTGTYTGVKWSLRASSAVALPDGATAISAGSEVVIHRDGSLTRFAAPDAVTSLYPGDDGSIYVGVTGFNRVVLHRMNTTTGATTLVESGPSLPLNFHGTGRPGVYASMPDGATLATYDPSGATLGSTDWPPDSDTTQQTAYIGTAPHPAGGWVSAWWSLNWITGAAHVAAVHDADDGTLTVTDLPHPSSHGLSLLAWSQSPVVASNGRTAVIVLTAHQDRSITGAAADTYGVTAWTVEVGSEALLHVAHQDGTWRKVGDESWALGPGRMLLGVPRSQSPSGWVMEVKPGDDTTNARTMYLEMPGGADRTAPVRMVPWPG